MQFDPGRFEPGTSYSTVRRPGRPASEARLREAGADRLEVGTAARPHPHRRRKVRREQRAL
eukprot:5556334-Prymnesium_polylepis.1